jgi:hypothetical protein
MKLGTERKAWRVYQVFDLDQITALGKEVSLHG